MPTPKSSLREGDPEWERIQTWLESPAYQRMVHLDYLRAVNWCNLNFGEGLDPHWEEATHEQPTAG